METKRRLWENLAPGLEASGESTLLLLKDWSWLIDSENGTPWLFVWIVAFLLILMRFHSTHH